VAVRYEASDGIATITLDRPEAMNAMTSGMYRDLTDCFRALDADDAIDVGIVTGSGEQAFSSGADLKEKAAAERPSGPWSSWRADRWDLGFEVCKPLIAAIDGYALAGGLELALFCDLRLATPRSRFGAPEVKWNVLHGRGALRLPAVVGLTNAMMLLLTAQDIDAEEALRIGLVNRIVEPADLLDEAGALARAIGSNARDAVRMTKELALRGVDVPLEQGLRLYHAYTAELEGTHEQLRRTRSFRSGAAGGDGAGPTPVSPESP
jgi:enoyl-CoA hydratase/carnithine racemase